MPLPRILALLLSLVGAVVSGHAETFNDWVSAAPAGAVSFTPWQAYPNNAKLPYGTAPPQGLYGYLDLSKIPPGAFPIRVRILYSGDSDRDDWGAGFHQLPEPPMAFSQITPTHVTLETTLASPDKAALVPVWTSPVSMIELVVRTGTVFETVRVEVVGHDDALLGRLFIGASPSVGESWNSRGAVTVNSPEASGVFQPAGLTITQVGRLVPDAYAYANVRTVWIDPSAAVDATLTDEFWRRLLLEGVLVSGHPEDIQTLATRLALNPAAPMLLGGFLANADLQPIANSLQEEIRTIPFGGIALSGTNPYQFNDGLSQTMHRQLIGFSRWYLGLFFVGAVIVVFAAFLLLRGRRRVWLWMVIPAFAIAYALLGVVVAPWFISSRAEARIEQLEMQQEGWPEACLVTGTWQVKLDRTPATYRFPADSHLSSPGGYFYNGQQIAATFRFSQTADGSEFVSDPGAAHHGEAPVRSWIPARAPIDVSADGRVTARRDFRSAWAWDGTQWRDLGELHSGEPLTLANAKISSAGEIQSPGYSNGAKRGEFPMSLSPLLSQKYTSALSGAGEGLFLGVQDSADCRLDDEASYRIQSRRVVAYQFHLPKGTP